MARFEVKGPFATKTLSNVLHVENGSENAKVLWEQITGNEMRTDSLPQDMVLSLTIKHPLGGATQKAKEQPNALVVKIPDNIAANAKLWEKHTYRTSKSDDSDIKMENTQVPREPVDIFLIQRTSGLSDGFGSGWDIICPINVSVLLWDRLSKQSM